MYRFLSKINVKDFKAIELRVTSFGDEYALVVFIFIFRGVFSKYLHNSYPPFKDSPWGDKAIGLRLETNLFGGPRQT